LSEEFTAIEVSFILAAAMWKRTLNLEARLLARLVSTPSRTSSSCLLPRATRPIGSAQFSLARPSRALVQLRANARSYSSAADAAAVREDDAAEHSGETKDVMKFADLGNLGLHENLLSAIVDGLKYDTMTEVQARTISSALASQDM
jgi:ATP-dependent RNA helicase MSS116